MATKAKITLVPHKAYMPSGKEIDAGQWYVCYDGVSIGYLSYKPGSTIANIRNFPEDEWKYIVSECERLREPPGPVLIPSAIQFPPGFNQMTGVPEDDDSTETEED